MESKNKISIDIGDNPELKDYLSRQKIGGTCRFEVEMQINDLTPTMVEGTINEIVLPEDGETPEKTVPSGMDHPIMIRMSGKSKSAAKKEKTPAPEYQPA